MSREQQAVLLKDAADLARGLVVLDIRYRNVPGWQFLEQQGRLMTAATAVSEGLDTEGLDTSIDGRGWRPTPGMIQGPALPGLAGVLQAQHNVAVDLSHFPSALRVRHVLVAQAEMSNQSARLAQSSGPRTGATFEERAMLYRELVVASRSVGGQLGAGRAAALESANAARRIAAGPMPGENVDQALGKLAHPSHRVDVKVATAIEHGFREKLYYVAIKLPTMGSPGPDGISRAAQKYIPLNMRRQCELLDLAHERLRPPPAAVQAHSDERRSSRSAFAATIASERAARPSRLTLLGFRFARGRISTDSLSTRAAPGP
jgi:hypothetical protein